MPKAKTIVIKGMQEDDDYRVDIVDRSDEKEMTGIYAVLEKAKKQAEVHNATARAGELTTESKKYISKE